MTRDDRILTMRLPVMRRAQELHSVTLYRTRLLREPPVGIGRALRPRIRG
jgi:hypothetical protein